MEKKYIAVYAPSNENNQMPSLRYTPRGYMSEEEISELHRNLVNTMGFLHEFPTKAHYEAYLREIDEQYYVEEPDDEFTHWDGDESILM